MTTRMKWTLIAVGALGLAGLAQHFGHVGIAGTLLSVGSAIFGKEYTRSSADPEPDPEPDHEPLPLSSRRIDL
ncbi:MAG: hypothetical protein ACE5EF_03885 [Dehalococcoidia bacterium]